MHFNALKIVERVVAGIVYRAAAFFSLLAPSHSKKGLLLLAAGGGIEYCEFTLKGHNFSFSYSRTHRRRNDTTESSGDARQHADRAA